MKSSFEKREQRKKQEKKNFRLYSRQKKAWKPTQGWEQPLVNVLPRKALHLLRLHLGGECFLYR